MRIDVDRDERIETELDALYERGVTRKGQDGLPVPGLPHLRLHRRIADGEWYVYVEDVGRARLAGCTVFNRVVEIDRRLDPHVRSPHSRFRRAYQRLGLATRIYAEVLEGGTCLLSGARQSPAAHALWQALGRRHPLWYVNVRERRLALLGTGVAPAVFQDLHTRLLLCGAGWDAEHLAGLSP